MQNKLQKNEKTVYSDIEVRLGVITENFTGYDKNMNGKYHSVIITNERLIFIPEDSNAKLKSTLAQGAIKFFGMHFSNNLTKILLANEGFDIYGERSVSMKYLPREENLQILEGCTVGITVFRRKDDTHANDFVSLPSTSLLIDFQSMDRASKFLKIFRETRKGWSEYR